MTAGEKCVDGEFADDARVSQFLRTSSEVSRRRRRRLKSEDGTDEGAAEGGTGVLEINHHISEPAEL